MSRAPHGARGLKRVEREERDRYVGRAPHGARGLKLGVGAQHREPPRSRPARGAWIETPYP